jgi:hypothetical protein
MTTKTYKWQGRDHVVKHADHEKVHKLLLRHGYSHITYPNSHEGDGERSTIILKPEDLKHRSSTKLDLPEEV